MMEKIFLSKLIINQQWKEKSKYLKLLNSYEKFGKQINFADI